MLALGAANRNGAQFVFDVATHSLSFDPDGLGTAPPVFVATLTGLTTLSASDIWIV
jgi:hypothetical protein